MSRATQAGRGRGMALVTAWIFLWRASVPLAHGYALNYVVADVRQPAAQSGGTACPQLIHFSTAGSALIARQWSTSLSANPVTILTQDQTPTGRLNELEGVIRDSFSMWTNISGTTLRGSTLGPLTRTTTQTACSSDGLPTICFNQNEALFTPGVLAFTRVITTDLIGAQPFPAHAPASFVGEILDADILLRPNDASVAFATPGALASQPKSYDFESVLAHELGHFFGLGHSGVWRAMMYSFVPPQGQFLGERPTPQAPDAPLAEDDRTAVRTLYPDVGDAAHIGSIRGRVLPANALSLPAAPAGVTGAFGAHVVAVDAATGAVVAGTLGGWSCSGAGPARFDGSFSLDRLLVAPGQAYKIYAEPLDGPVDAGQTSSSTAGLCRNTLTDPGWPPALACRTPAVTTNFTTRARPAL